MKICSKCKHEKPDGEFQRKLADGSVKPTKVCAGCRAAMHEAYQKKSGKTPPKSVASPVPVGAGPASSGPRGGRKATSKPRGPGRTKTPPSAITPDQAAERCTRIALHGPRPDDAKFCQWLCLQLIQEDLEKVRAELGAVV